MRTCLLCAALCLGFLLSPSPLVAAPSSEEVLARWQEALQRLDQGLRQQEWRRVAKDARGLVDEMVDQVLTGDGAAQMIALAVAEQAIAEAGLGHQEEAVWLWHVALNLDPALGRMSFVSYGPAGEKLQPFKLRPPGGMPGAGGSNPSADASYEPPRVIREEEPRTPAGLASARVAEGVEVEMIVRPDGQAVEPVLLSAPEYPALAFVVLQSLRAWRFEPARSAGTPVSALFRVRIVHPGLAAAAERYPGPQRPSGSLLAERAVLEQKLADLDARLRRGDWQAVHAPAFELVSRLRDSGSEDGPLAEGLRVLALAEAGMGRTEEAVWHWQVAQNLQAGLALDPAPYGEAGRLLAQHKLRRQNEPPAGMEAIPADDLGADATPPRKIEGDEMAVTGFLTLPQIRKWARVQVVIDAEGRVVAPVSVGGGPAALRWTALETVRTWRFEPARRAGQPVAVLLNLTFPESVGIPLAKMVSPGNEMSRLQELLLAGKWSKARNGARNLVASLPDETDLEPREVAGALAFLALAEAGAGDPAVAACYWQAAQGFDGDLYHADLAAYGTAGSVLEASNPWTQPVEDIPRFAPGGGGVLRPEFISGRPPQYTVAARRAGIMGDVAAEAILDEQGHVTQPRVLKALPLGLDLALVSALCEWRFKPATYQGKPVKVYYTLTVSFKQSP